MHETRVVTDALLAEGKIEEAEAYMEQRRIIFVKHGYLIRKINQAYFAFYGAYADSPGGAAGEDPVGPAVRALREQSNSLADFVNTISWMTSFEQLQEAVASISGARTSVRLCRNSGLKSAFRKKRSHETKLYYFIIIHHKPFHTQCLCICNTDNADSNCNCPDTHYYRYTHS